MKKRWTAALLALCFVLSLAPYALAAEEPPGAPSAGTGANPGRIRRGRACAI